MNQDERKFVHTILAIQNRLNNKFYKHNFK